MGRGGTAVAREAADLVLADDFATIVAAVEQGRATFANIRRFLTYHLTGNVAELASFVAWALTGGGLPLALGVLQVLALGIRTDVLPAPALGAEPAGPRVLEEPPPRGQHLFDRSLLTRAFGMLEPVEALVELTAFVAVLLVAGWRPGAAPPVGPALLAASGTAFACRSATRWPGALGWATNRWLVCAVAAEGLLLLAFLFVPLARSAARAGAAHPGRLGTGRPGRARRAPDRRGPEATARAARGASGRA